MRQSEELQTCTLIELICGDSHHDIQRGSNSPSVPRGGRLYEPVKGRADWRLNSGRTKPVFCAMDPVFELFGGQNILERQRVAYDPADEETGERELTRTAERRASGETGQRRKREAAWLERIRRTGRGNRRRRHAANL